MKKDTLIIEREDTFNFHKWKKNGTLLHVDTLHPAHNSLLSLFVISSFSFQCVFKTLTVL